VRLKADVIVTAGPPGTRAAKEAAVTIPIVMGFDKIPLVTGSSPVWRGLAETSQDCQLAPELSGKQLELLKEVVPKLSRVAVLGTSTQPGTAQSLREVELAAGAFGVKLQHLDVLDPKDLETGFQAATKEHAEAFLVLQSAVINPQRKQIADFAAKNRLPAIYPQTEYTESGGLMYYGANTAELFWRAATYVDKILKGTKPADLPVEQPKKFELIINLKAAKQIGLTIPPNVLVRADKVIR